jgi:diguanylate cyclase (GGDEF)-like protein
MINVDAVTGLEARASLDIEFARSVARATPRSPFSLVMVDVDRFKAINDKHGHPKGDAVLAAVALQLRTAVDGKGRAFRFGGEEFALLLPNHTCEEAIAVAERTRRALEISASDGLQVTASFGVRTLPDLASSAPELLARADAALYDAKSRGRNLVRLHGEPPPSQPARGPQKKEPQAGTLTDVEMSRVREEYFVYGLARCPRDQAVLEVHEDRVLRRTPTPVSLVIVCKLCGLTAKV